MNRDELNIYIDAYLGLSSDPKAARRTLIEEASGVETPLELIRRWILLQSVGVDQILELKSWFGLSYSDLGEILHVSAKEVGQLLRKQRAALLPAYPSPGSLQEGDEAAFGGISCFMVEQHMSAWVDGELQDIPILRSLKVHLASCEACTARLEAYRELQASILKQRAPQASISQKEWDETLEAALRRFRIFLGRTVGVVILVIVVGTLGVWALRSKSEKMPNIYEIPEETTETFSEQPIQEKKDQSPE